MGLLWFFTGSVDLRGLSVFFSFGLVPPGRFVFN